MRNKLIEYAKNILIKKKNTFIDIGCNYYFQLCDFTKINIIQL